MNENIVIVGAKNSLVEEISKVVEENQDKVYFVKDSSENGWNRASPISARSNILQVKNVFEEIHKFIIIYDSSEYMRFNSFDVESISKGFDSTILGFSYFTSEIMKLYSEQGFGDFVFVVLDDEEMEEDIFSGFEPWLRSYNNPDYTGKQKYNGYARALLKLVDFMKEQGIIEDSDLNDKNMDKYYS